MTTCPSPRTLCVPADQAAAIKAESLRYKSIILESSQLCELELLLSRAYQPLSGFMGAEDLSSVLESLCLADGTPWALPVSLDIPDGLAERLAQGERLALRDGEGFMLAVLTVEEVFRVDPLAVARAMYGVDDPSFHPGAAAFLHNTRSWRVAGRVDGLAMPVHNDYTELRRLPEDVRLALSQRGWRQVLGYQALPFPNKADRAALLHAALDVGASILMLHPVCDVMVPEVEHFSAVRSVVQFSRQIPATSRLLGLLPYAAQGAGPRQALHEAIIHKNYGCTHFLVAPDHGDPLAAAGLPPLYPLGSAQQLVADQTELIGITMVPQATMAYVEEKAQYLPQAQVTPDQTVKELSKVELCRRLKFDLEIPDWFSFPEIVSELRQTFPPRSRQGFTVFMTGLSGAGKSTLAKLLYIKFMELHCRPVTLLDGDIVRRHLSSELTFSKAHRNLNIERIGYVASEITKNGGIAICASIAPYASSRRRARDLVSRFGGFVEIHVATPLTVCEQRDRKGLYSKARAGVVSGVTGIDDPYEIPDHPNLVLDTSNLSPSEAIQEVMLYLEREGYLMWP